jgi:hypothetical protein
MAISGSGVSGVQLPPAAVLRRSHTRGRRPSGISGVVRSTTNFAATMPRIFLNDTPEDQAAIQPLLNQILVYPLRNRAESVRCS